jgi:hypothetical protein
VKRKSLTKVWEEVGGMKEKRELRKGKISKDFEVCASTWWVF